jgi:hypothetical protein
LARYRYNAMSTDAFEKLVVDICSKLLGQGITGFAKGRDGGRDAKFEGTTNGFPSFSGPWTGVTIVQAKHVDKVEGSYSDKDFFGNKNSVLNEEIPRIRALVAKEQLDHYIIFSNRKMTGGVEQKIKDEISCRCGLPTSDIAVYGVEKLDDLLCEYSAIPGIHNLDLLEAPLRITRDALADVIAAIHDALDIAAQAANDGPSKRVDLKKKNELNNVEDEIIEPYRKKFLKYTGTIESFLASPINEDLLNKYTEAMEELNCRLPGLIKSSGSFMGAWHGISDILVNNEEVLRKNAHLLRAVQFYMYWNCDFGKDEEDAPAEQTL